MIAHDRTESTIDSIYYRRFIHQFPPDTIKSMQRIDRINTKMFRQNLFRFYVISIFAVYLFSYKWTVLFQTIKFILSRQFDFQKHFYFRLLSLVKLLYFKQSSLPWVHSLNIKTVLLQVIQFYISTHISSIWPIHRTPLGANTPCKSGLGSYGNEECSIFPKVPAFLEHHHQIFYCHRQDIRWGNLSLSIGAADVFYIPSWLGKYRQKMPILFNKICIKGEILPKYTYLISFIYIYIYIYNDWNSA